MLLYFYDCCIFKGVMVFFKRGFITSSNSTGCVFVSRKKPKNGILFCFFFYDTSEEKFLTSDLSFSQVTEVDKREPRESFSKPRPHFWGRGRRPRPRNEQAEAEKCSPRFPFVYWGNWGNLKSDVDKFLPKKVASTIIKTECFFHLSGFFVTFNRFSEWEKWKLD